MNIFTDTPEELDKVLNRAFKAYDVRGIVGEDLNEDIVEAVGAAFVDEIGLAGQEVLIGFDMRPSSPVFAEVFARGAASRGAHPVILGLTSTDELYFASGFYDKAAVQFTASHNPAAYNGIKMNRAGAKGLSSESGLKEIKEKAKNYLLNGIPSVEDVAEIQYREIMPAYVEHLRRLVPLENVRPLKIVVDAANGMGGYTVPHVFQDASFAALPLEIIPMYFELDGTFPNHEANPLDPKNLVDLQARVVAEGADLGLAFDGDADRCFIVDEKGDPVSASAIAALIAVRKVRELREENRYAPVKILHSLTTSWFVPEVISSMGAEPVRVRVGHSYAKATMASTGAVFGGEHSGHYYFGDFWNADSGILAAMHTIAELASEEGQTMSGLNKKYDPYFCSGEINSTVADAKKSVHKIQELFPSESYTVDLLDGLSVSSGTVEDEDWWWFNLRSSNTEPLLRLNCEASSEEKMNEIRDLVLQIIRS